MRNTERGRIVLSMSLKREKEKVLCSWTNGTKAVVHLVELPTGAKQILKVYKPGFNVWMLREYMNTLYISKRLSIVPKIL